MTSTASSIAKLAIPLSLLLPCLPGQKPIGPEAPKGAQGPAGKAAAQPGQLGKRAANAPAGSHFALPTAKAEETPFTMPFRVFLPSQDFELSTGWRATFADANEMYRLWSESKERAFDEDGRPTTKDGHFKTLRDKLIKRLARQGGMLRVYRSDESNAGRRRAATFASMFITPIQDAVHLFRLLPYEPVASLRQEGIEFTKAFLDAQVSSSFTNAQGKSTGPKFVFDAAPWLDLSRSPQAKDKVLALEVLTIVGKARGKALRDALPLMKPWIPDLLRHENKGVREATKTFLTELEPEARFPTDIEQSLEYFGRVYKKIFPPIRLAGGVCELFPSPELDELVADVVRILEDRSATKVENRTVKKRFGTFERRGIRVLKLTERMKSAGLGSKMLFTTFNGQPIDSAQALLKSLRGMDWKKQSRCVLEWVNDKGLERARTYLLRPKESS